MLDFLLNQGADVNAVDNNGLSALHLAILRRRRECVIKLSKHNALIDLPTPFSKASTKRLIEELMSDVLPICKSTQDDEGETDISCWWRKLCYNNNTFVKPERRSTWLDHSFQFYMDNTLFRYISPSCERLPLWFCYVTLYSVISLRYSFQSGIRHWLTISNIIAGNILNYYFVTWSQLLLFYLKLYHMLWLITDVDCFVFCWIRACIYNSNIDLYKVA